MYEAAPQNMTNWTVWNTLFVGPSAAQTGAGLCAEYMRHGYIAITCYMLASVGSVTTNCASETPNVIRRIPSETLVVNSRCPRRIK
jgi:hypothetical protein